MRRLLQFLLLAAALGGGWYVNQLYRLVGLEQLQLRPREGSQTVPLAGPPQEAPPPASRDGDTIHIASFNIQVLGESKLSKPHVVELLVDILRRFDVVAIQEIRAKNQSLLADLIAQVNAEDRHYDYVLGPRQGRTSSKEQYAFVFDAQSVEVDRLNVYTVNDPDDLLHRPPLVASFRVRGPPAEQAFTFTLVNVHTDPDEAAFELSYLDDAYLGVRNDGRGEDDVILLGDLNADADHLNELGQLPKIRPLITGTTTNTRRTELYDHIIIHVPSTTEFTGRSGVLDIESHYGLSREQALEVSDHLPVWAEMSIYESAGRPRFAQQPDAPVLRE